MRVTRVEHAQKPQSCGKCGCKIKPSRNEKQSVTNKRTGKTKKKIVRVLGDSYIWIKFNRGPKRVRCSKSECRFRPSDMTTSDKLSTLYGAQETAEDAVADWDGEDGSIDGLKQAMEDLATAIEEVKDGYNESADNMEQVFTGGSPTIDECREKADNLDSWHDEIDGMDFDEWDGPERKSDEDEEGEKAESKKDDAEEPKNSDGETFEEWVESQRNKADEAIGNCPI